MCAGADPHEDIQVVHTKYVRHSYTHFFTQSIFENMDSCQLFSSYEHVGKTVTSTVFVNFHNLL